VENEKVVGHVKDRDIKLKTFKDSEHKLKNEKNQF
jgi:hypothetical protein